MKTPEFTPWPKIARPSRQIIITEKIDGRNASVFIAELPANEPIPDKSLGVFDIDGILYFMLAGSRTRWITPDDDNYGFAAWVARNFDCLKQLGPGHHFGEWWGSGVHRPSCCHVVPILYEGIFTPTAADDAIFQLAGQGSKAAPGFMNAEGIIVYHSAANLCFKKTIMKDEEPKGKPTK